MLREDWKVDVMELEVRIFCFWRMDDAWTLEGRILLKSRPVIYSKSIPPEVVGGVLQNLSKLVKCVEFNVIVSKSLHVSRSSHIILEHYIKLYFKSIICLTSFLFFMFQLIYYSYSSFKFRILTSLTIISFSCNQSFIAYIDWFDETYGFYGGPSYN